jgi:hypothetical protein
MLSKTSGCGVDEDWVIMITPPGGFEEFDEEIIEELNSSELEDIAVGDELANIELDELATGEELAKMELEELTIGEEDTKIEDEETRSIIVPESEEVATLPS